jgi:hypothetical protein
MPNSAASPSTACLNDTEFTELRSHASSSVAASTVAIGFCKATPWLKRLDKTDKEFLSRPSVDNSKLGSWIWNDS